MAILLNKIDDIANPRPSPATSISHLGSDNRSRNNSGNAMPGFLSQASARSRNNSQSEKKLDYTLEFGKWGYNYFIHLHALSKNLKYYCLFKIKMMYLRPL